MHTNKINMKKILESKAFTLLLIVVAWSLFIGAIFLIRKL